MFILLKKIQVDSSIITYFENYGDANCCFDDIKCYLKNVQPELRKEFMQKLTSISDSFDADKVFDISYTTINPQLLIFFLENSNNQAKYQY